MSFDYTRVRGTAERLLERFGQTATLIKPGEMIGPEWNPTPGPATEHSITVVDENSLRRDLSGTLIGEGVHSIIVSTSAGVAPSQADRIRMGGREYEIVEVKPLAPGGVVLLWECTIQG